MKIALLGAAGMAMLPLPAVAAVFTYTDANAFQAAAGSTTLETFNDASPATLASPENPAVAGAYGNFLLSGNANGDYVALASGGERGTIDGTNFLYIGQVEPEMFNIGDGDLGPSLTFTFGSAITAFGFDWTDLDISDSYRVDFSGPGFTSVGFSTPPFSLNGEGAGFFGFRSDTAFTTVMFTQNAAGGFVDAFGIDNIRTSSSLSAPAVPEPATWAMMILGFGAVGLSLRRAANVRVASQAA